MPRARCRPSSCPPPQSVAPWSLSFVPCVLCASRAAGACADAATRWASVRRAWAARSPPSPTTPRRPGGTRRAWPVGPTSAVSSNTAICREPRPIGNGQAASAIAFPALGLSYYRLPISEMRPASLYRAGSRRSDKIGTAALDVEQFGVTVGQSLGNHSGRRLDAEGHERAAQTPTAGLDVGGMVTFGMAQIGLIGAQRHRARRSARAPTRSR